MPKNTSKSSILNAMHNGGHIIPTKSSDDFHRFMSSKISQVIDIIQRTFTSIDYCKKFDVFSNSTINQCLDHLYTIYEKTNSITNLLGNKDKMDDAIQEMQQVFDKLSVFFTTYGSNCISDIYYVVFGARYNNKQTISETNSIMCSKLDLIEKYTIPIGYKNISWNEITENENTNKISDLVIKPEIYPHMECFEPVTLYSSLHQSVYGIRILARNEEDEKSIIINGILRDIPLQYLKGHEYVQVRMSGISEYFKNMCDIFGENEEISMEIVNRWIETVTLKELFIFTSEDLHKKFNTMLSDANYVKKNKIETIIKHFFDMDITCRRRMLMNLFIYDVDHEVQYIAYMLYDLIGSSDNMDGGDNYEQRLIYESMPWKLKDYFKDTMINTIQYTQDNISQGDTSKVSLEQQVLLMRADNKVKDKALAKLKDVKGKPEDQASKSKQYLEGLLKIPFGVYRKEPILCKMKILNNVYQTITSKPKGEKYQYTLFEITSEIETLISECTSEFVRECRERIDKGKKDILVHVVKKLNSTMIPSKTKQGLIEMSKKLLNDAIEDNNHKSIIDVLELFIPLHPKIAIYNKLIAFETDTKCVEQNLTLIENRLDDSIYAHNEAKSQIMKIIGQWINGEQNGYCFGFEGSPGVGKTSLAKRGLAQCLQDDDGNARPFSFIALGGSSNGSTLEGHNYTYVNSTWGKIVDVLMESKCMNPIIYIDELDKVSKTEQGREIIGILTHLIDATQNDEFEDRYFSGIPVDLSKVLFIFSYNDPEQIDRVLLDRIHRIRFDNLTWTDKLVIVDKYIMPELNKKMGFDNTVKLSDEVIRHLVETYTMEPGVRKLKELLFDLFGEINLQLLNYEKVKPDTPIQLPIEIKIEDLGTTYLKKYRKMHNMEIHKEPLVGTINGMWANALGRGGIIPIEARTFPTSTFLDLKLTGMQGDVMKESMNVSKTNAWALISVKQQSKLLKQFESTKMQGLHIHCPEGAVPKDGPSAGGAITLALYSLLTNQKINNTVSMTGEINLQGQITAIGGLDSKIMGSMRAGVKTVLYPKDNQREFDEFMEKYGSSLDLSEMSFHSVETIKDAIKFAIV